MEDPHTTANMNARSRRHEVFAHLYLAGSLGALAVAGALFDKGSGVPANKLELLAGAASAIGGALSGKKALERARLSGAESGGALGMELQTEMNRHLLTDPDLRQN